jgi:hypothetical protein
VSEMAILPTDCAYQRWLVAVGEYERAYARIPWWRRLFGATPPWPEHYWLFPPDCGCPSCNGS